MISWYAIRVRSNCEPKVEAALRDTFETFFPARPSIRRIGANERAIQLPFFPGYVFSRFDWSERVAVLRVPQVVQILSFQRDSAGIPEHEIEAVRLLARSPYAVMPHPYLKTGDAIRVIRGPLSGVEGFVAYLKGTVRIVVSVHLLGRSVSTEIDQESIEPLAPARLAA